MDPNTYFEIQHVGKSHKVFILNEKQVADIFKLENPIKLTRPVFSEMSLDVYKIENGVVVIREGENEFPLYPSEEILVNQLSNHSVVAKDILEGLSIYGKDFPANAKKLAEDFLNQISVDAKATTIEILKAVDKHINLYRDKKFLDENFLNLISVIGELVNKEYQTNWVAVKSKSSGTWTPAIIYKGQYIYFDDYILIDFDNKNEPSPLLNVYLSIVDILKTNIR